MQAEALILAGGRAKIPGYDVEEALIPLAGRPMVDYVLQAVRGASGVGRVCLVGSEKLCSLYRDREDLILAPAGNEVLESLANGLQVLNPREWVLVATADIPLVTPAMISDFLARCQEKPADFYYAILRRETNEARFPGTRRTYVRLREGVFCGGNLFLVRPEVVVEGIRRGAAIAALRKNPLGLARLIGPGFILKLLFHRLSLAEAETKFSQLLGLTGVTVISPYAEVGVDVDKEEDLALVKAALETEARGER